MSKVLNKIISIVRKNYILLIILAIGLFLRSYKAVDWYMYGHDQDIAAWIIKDIVKDGHIRLIGQETSSKGIFIGSLFYYLQIPFYSLTNWDPKGALLLPLVISIFSIYSHYFVFSKIFNKKIGIIAALIYASSYLVIFSEREVAPTMPVWIWSVWFLYAIWLLLKGKQKVYILLGILGGLIWHLSLGLALLTPLVAVAQILSKKKINFKYLLTGSFIFFVLMIPFFAFEARHGFQQTHALITSFTTKKDYVQGTSTGFAKMDRVMQLVHKNANALFLDSVFNLAAKWMFYVLIVLFVILLAKKKISWQIGLLAILWQALFVLFFTFNSINTSEYYLNGMNVIWLMLISVSLGSLSGKLKFLLYLILAFIVSVNLYAFFNHSINESGYVQRKAIVQYIADDSKAHGYPCVSVSYITSPGNNLGYRYLFYLLGLHVNQPNSNSPVYSIVFPHSMVNGIDKSFGALGLVLPDYHRYNEKDVKVSCSGEDSNLTDPVFGFTK
jgi:4-amino-4-deoxy-L-arabinose transferase-like glycosyltransferase